MKPVEAFRRRRLPILLACAVALLSSGAALAAGAGAAPQLKEPRAKKVSLLYVLNAKRATLLPEAGSKTAFRFAVKGAEPDVDWFSDRPARDSGAFPARLLATDWAGFGFTADPPNVAVDYVDSHGRDRTAMLVLRKPVLHKGVIVFAAHLLDPKRIDDANLAAHARRADTTPPRRLRNVAVFVDDSEAMVLSGCVLQPGTSCVGAAIGEASIAGIDLSGANFSHASLEAFFKGTNLTGANLTDADLSGSAFLEVDLQGADTEGVDWGSAIFCRTEMPNGTLNNSGCTPGMGKDDLVTVVA